MTSGEDQETLHYVTGNVMAYSLLEKKRKNNINNSNSNDTSDNDNNSNNDDQNNENHNNGTCKKDHIQLHIEAHMQNDININQNHIKTDLQNVEQLINII